MPIIFIKFYYGLIKFINVCISQIGNLVFGFYINCILFLNLIFVLLLDMKLLQTIFFLVNLFVHLICTNTQKSGGLDREGYFNSSSWLNLYPPISLHKHVGLSFRTCSGGQIFSQTHEFPFTKISVSVLPDSLLFTAFLQSRHYESKIQGDFFDNSWHNVNLIYKLGELIMSIDGLQQVNWWT